MRYFLALAALSIFVTGCAGMKSVPAEQLTYRKVLDAPGFTKDELWEKSKLWIARTFKPSMARTDFQTKSKGLILYESKQDGILVGNGSFFYPETGDGIAYREGWEIRFTLEIDVKDARARISFSNLSIFEGKTFCGGVYPEWRGSFEKPLVFRKDWDVARPILSDLTDSYGNFLRSAEPVDAW